jgi:hypothetical protein
LDPKAVLKNIQLSAMGECSICGDLLLAAPASVKDQTLERVMETLETLFRNHLAQRHGIFEAPVRD